MLRLKEKVILCQPNTNIWFRIRRLHNTLSRLLDCNTYSHHSRLRLQPSVLRAYFMGFGLCAVHIFWGADCHIWKLFSQVTLALDNFFRPTVGFNVNNVPACWCSAHFIPVLQSMLRLPETKWPSDCSSCFTRNKLLCIFSSTVTVTESWGYSFSDWPKGL